MTYSLLWHSSGAVQSEYRETLFQLYTNYLSFKFTLYTYDTPRLQWVQLKSIERRNEKRVECAILFHFMLSVLHTRINNIYEEEIQNNNPVFY